MTVVRHRDSRAGDQYSEKRLVDHQREKRAKTQLNGGRRDGTMVLSGEVPGPAGAAILSEISWERIDSHRVRHYWRASRDGGTTWTDVFIGVYIRGG